MEHLELKRKMIRACRRLIAKGFVVGTYGNVSVRIPGGLIITPSRIDVNMLAPDDMVTVSDDGRVLEGTRVPSSELEVHRQILCARPDILSAVHTHSPWATAVACAHGGIPPILDEQSQVLGGEVRCTRYVLSEDHEALAREAVRILGSSNAVLLANHGAVACGRSIEEALLASEVVERVAQMFLLAHLIKEPVPIAQEHVASERERWLFRYGTVADGTIAHHD